MLMQVSACGFRHKGSAEEGDTKSTHAAHSDHHEEENITSVTANEGVHFDRVMRL